MTENSLRGQDFTQSPQATHLFESNFSSHRGLSITRASEKQTAVHAPQLMQSFSLNEILFSTPSTLTPLFCRKSIPSVRSFSCPSTSIRSSPPLPGSISALRILIDRSYFFTRLNVTGSTFHFTPPAFLPSDLSREGEVSNRSTA